MSDLSKLFADIQSVKHIEIADFNLSLQRYLPCVLNKYNGRFIEMKI